MRRTSCLQEIAGLPHKHPGDFAVPPKHEELKILRVRLDCRELV